MSDNPPGLRFDVEVRQPQVLVIAIAGPDVALIERPDGPSRATSEDALPDVVHLWARAAQLGMFGSARGPASPPSVRVSGPARDAEGRASWRLDLDGVDWGALRVLTNLLLARRLEEVVVRTEQSAPLPSASPSQRSPRPAQVALGTLAFPRAPARAPFVVTREPIVKASRQRAVRVEFSRPLSDADVDAAVAALDLWADLIVWGGYAAPDMEPRQSGALPDGALLYDETTVAQQFAEAFYCDEAAFDGVISYALARASQEPRVVEIAIQ